MPIGACSAARKMKLWILLVVFLLGPLTFEVKCQSGSGDVENDDENDIEISEEEAEENEEDDNDDDDNEYYSENVYEIDCDHFNLELCLYNYENHELFDQSFNEDAVCWESFASADCMHDFASECFPDSAVKEELLCKLNNFKDRITVLCLNDSHSIEEEPTDEEILECLEGAEVDTEQCVEEIIPQIRDIIEENKDKFIPGDVESAKNIIQCLVVSRVLECTVQRLEDRCPAEVIEGFVEGAEEALTELLGDKCETQTIHEIASKK